MTNTDAMFWSGETLSEQLPSLIEPFAPERVDCAAQSMPTICNGFDVPSFMCTEAPFVHSSSTPQSSACSLSSPSLAS